MKTTQEPIGHSENHYMYACTRPYTNTHTHAHIFRVHSSYCPITSHLSFQLSLHQPLCKTGHIATVLLGFLVFKRSGFKWHWEINHGWNYTIYITLQVYALLEARKRGSLKEDKYYTSPPLSMTPSTLWINSKCIYRERDYCWCQAS